MHSTTSDLDEDGAALRSFCDTSISLFVTFRDGRRTEGTEKLYSTRRRCRHRSPFLFLFRRFKFRPIEIAQRFPFYRDDLVLANRQRRIALKKYLSAVRDAHLAAPVSVRQRTLSAHSSLFYRGEKNNKKKKTKIRFLYCRVLSIGQKGRLNRH